MTGNLRLLTNFVEKFLGTVKFRNDQIAPILGYGDLVESINGKKYAQIRTVGTNKGMEFLNKTLHAYFAKEGIRHETSTARSPKQNGVVERQNRTLVEAARTMLSVAKVPLFFWAVAIATACFTQNLSLVIPRHEKTPYHIINGQKLSVNITPPKLQQHSGIPHGVLLHSPYAQVTENDLKRDVLQNITFDILKSEFIKVPNGSAKTT
nr:retrovirus-related Pol polyprotein from transposon TNT 1-94 [Tanacetum cinerariifolium]